MIPFESVPLKYTGGELLVLDQRLLPQSEVWISCRTPQEMITCIRQLSVRGAPAIGLAGALALAQFSLTGASLEKVRQVANELALARPTAVNLANAIHMMMDGIERQEDLEQLPARAHRLVEIEREMSENMSEHGSALIHDGDGILTHCNAGALVTSGLGTALAPIAKAHQKGKKIHVFVDETRPLLQGARLTTWELERLKIPYTLICDNMAATLMRQGRIQRAIVGADRIALNGDSANKIGTYSAAVAAHYHGIPFHFVAPTTTIDFHAATGHDIPIEERSPQEVRGAVGSFGNVMWSPINSPVFNPSFDVTPIDLIHSIVLDSGIYFQESIKSGALKALFQQRLTN